MQIYINFKHFISSTGPIILLQLNYIRQLTNLDNVSLGFRDTVAIKDKYLLLGVIRYINHQLSSNCNFKTLSMGFYTCISRRNGSWYEFNDLKIKKVTHLKSSASKKVHIEFLIYLKVDY